MPHQQQRQRRAYSFTRSIASYLVPKFVWSFFSRPHPFLFHPPPNAPAYPPAHPLQPYQPQPRHRTISRPHNLRRSHYPTYRIAHPHFIHHLPPELLSLIFTLGAQSDSLLPITVSHVCSAWRTIALSTPSLWRRISLSPHERMWRERIHRARATTLDVELYPWRTVRGGYKRSQDLNAYTVQWYMYLVLPFLPRFRSLSIVFTDYAPYLWRAALSGLGSPAPQLQSLSLIYRFNDNPQPFLLFSEHAPLLRSLTIDGIRLVWSRDLYANLTSLDYTHHGFTHSHDAVHEVLSMLSVCASRLLELRVLFPRGPRRPAHPPPTHTTANTYTTQRIRLRLLQRLTLSIASSDIPFELAHLCTLLSLPRLTTLHLSDTTSTPYPFPSLKSFFYVFPLPQSLRCIEIECGWYDARMVQPMSTNLPGLERIVVRRARVPEQVVRLAGRMKEVRGSLGRVRGGTMREYRSVPVVAAR